MLPTGTVTFLMTDIEGSTRAWVREADAMPAAVSRHYEILDEAVAAHGGVRPVEQGEGDSVVAAFSRASDAVAAAVTAQQLLGAEPWPDGVALSVRMAIHTGEAQLRDDGNYFGLTVIRCARVRSCGHGGQVLLSDVTAALVSDRLPEGSALIDLGLHRLKDLGRPERVWQLQHPDLRAEFPPLQSLDAFRHNLPVQLSPLIGRRREIAAVVGLTEAERLVTLTGSGGVGKTRLALAVGAEVVAAFPGGVWFVELAAANGPGVVGRATLKVLGATETPGVSLAEVAAVELGDNERSLVILDNCEHLVDECANFVSTVLQRNPAVTVLATSREQLGVTGEIAWRVPSLSSPPTDELPGGRGAVAVRRRQPVRRPGSTSPTLVRCERGQRARHRSDLPSARRDPVGGGTGGGPVPPPEHRADRDRARRPVPLADRRTTRGAAPATDARRLRRLELRPPRRHGAQRPATSRGVRRGRSRSKQPKPSPRLRVT